MINKQEISEKLASYKCYFVVQGNHMSMIDVLDLRTGQHLLININHLEITFHRKDITYSRFKRDAKLKVITDAVSEYFDLHSDKHSAAAIEQRIAKITQYNKRILPKKILYVDLDGVMVDIVKEYNTYKENNPDSKKDLVAYIDVTEDGFKLSSPIEHSLRSLEVLQEKYDTYILSTAPWKNINSWSQKREWVERFLPKMRKRLILSPRKELLNGDFLIDDRLRNGTVEFMGEHIHIFSNKYPSWDSVLKKLLTSKEYKKFHSDIQYKENEQV